MKKEKNSLPELKKQIRFIRIPLFLEIILTICIAFSVFYTAWNSIADESKQYTSNICKDLNTTVSGYCQTFATMLVPIKEKIAENPSFDEMLTWMQSKDAFYEEALGSDIYDGIAFTYKGGYVRSWSYGDYTNYDAKTRLWYQQAQDANGEITVVAPYVTYLDSTVINENDSIIMTIAQKYNDEISFDLDIKIKDIKNLLEKDSLSYDGEKIFLFDENGRILSSTDSKEYAHSIFSGDDVIGKDYSETIKNNYLNYNKLQVLNLNGNWNFAYFNGDDSGNTVCLIVPCLEVFIHRFLLIFAIVLISILFEVYLYFNNKKNLIDFVSRNKRLDIVANVTYSERLYVDATTMTFSGNDRAGKLCHDGTYDELYALMKSRIADESELPRFEAYLKPESIKRDLSHQYEILAERFLMSMQDKDGTMRDKTIEVSKIAFISNHHEMVAIALRDASESVDLLKAALRETEQAKKEKAEEYDRFMSYICTAVDLVTELNIDGRTMTKYFMVDEKLVVEHEDYPDDKWIIFHPDDMERAKEVFNIENLKRLCENNQTADLECRMKWKNSNSFRWCTAIIQGIPPTKEKPFSVLLILKDVNEIREKDEKQRKALEDAFKLAQEGSKAKGSFLSKMSHEIRTPLNAIIGYVSIAKDADSSQQQVKHCLDNCEIASKHLLQIINDVLDMSSIESGSMKIAHEDFDLKKEISDITTIFYQNAKMKNVRFETQIEELMDEWVIGDHLRLNQVLMNLLSNAVKFTPENGLVKLRIQQVNQTTDERVFIQFTVSDTGIGMSEEYMSRLFKPFEQESATTAQKYGGSGLGLSITRNLIDMMGGTITVESHQNQGSTFVVTLHFDKSKEHGQISENLVDYAHVRVLVVDDQPDDCSYVKTMLKRCGVKADSVTSGALALKRIRSRKGTDYEYDMCILDWSMPEMNGVEVATRIREEFGENLPIIIATAYDITEFIDDAKRVGVNRIIAKPLFQSTLFDLLVTTFGKYDPSAGKIGNISKVDMSGMHIILAEDNDMNMEIAVSVLEKAGIKVDQAKNGQIAYELLMNAPVGTYDLILMDVQMPVLDGYEATRKIRASAHPEATTIPIIAMTANAFAEDVTAALASGMNAHISKPVNNEKLFSVLNEFAK